MLMYIRRIKMFKFHGYSINEVLMIVILRCICVGFDVLDSIKKQKPKRKKIGKLRKLCYARKGI